MHMNMVCMYIFYAHRMSEYGIVTNKFGYDIEVYRYQIFPFSDIRYSLF